SREVRAVLEPLERRGGNAGRSNRERRSLAGIDRLVGWLSKDVGGKPGQPAAEPVGDILNLVGGRRTIKLQGPARPRTGVDQAAAQVNALVFPKPQVGGLGEAGAAAEGPTGRHDGIRVHGAVDIWHLAIGERSAAGVVM